MNTVDIEKILAGGATPEEIYAEAKRIAEAKDAAKAKLVEKAREAAMDALVAYSEALTGDSVSSDFKNDMREYFQELERVLSKLNKPAATRAEEKKECGKCTTKTCSNKNTNKNDPIAEFLKEIGAL